MAVVHISKVEKVPKRPYTISLKGSIGHNSFLADLEGVWLNIKSSHPLTDDEVEGLQERLRKLFPSNDKFKKKDIDHVMEENGGTLSIKV